VLRNALIPFRRKSIISFLYPSSCLLFSLLTPHFLTGPLIRMTRENSSPVAKIDRFFFFFFHPSSATLSLRNFSNPSESVPIRFGKGLRVMRVLRLLAPLKTFSLGISPRLCGLSLYSSPLLNHLALSLLYHPNDMVKFHLSPFALAFSPPPFSCSPPFFPNTPLVGSLDPPRSTRSTYPSQVLLFNPTSYP